MRRRQQASISVESFGETHHHRSHDRSSHTVEWYFEVGFPQNSPPCRHLKRRHNIIASKEKSAVRARRMNTRRMGVGQTRQCVVIKCKCWLVGLDFSCHSGFGVIRGQVKQCSKLRCAVRMTRCFSVVVSTDLPKCLRGILASTTVYAHI